MGFNSFSQTDIQKDSVVILTKKQAIAVATDLVRYDACKASYKLQENRIELLNSKIVEFVQIGKKKDSIIDYQKEFIYKQSKILESPFKPKIHSNLGIQSIGFNLVPPFIYGNVFISFKKINVGAVYYVRPEDKSRYGIFLEYKLF